MKTETLETSLMSQIIHGLTSTIIKGKAGDFKVLILSTASFMRLLIVFFNYLFVFKLKFIFLLKHSSCRE